MWTAFIYSGVLQGILTNPPSHSVFPPFPFSPTTLPHLLTGLLFLQWRKAKGGSNQITIVDRRTGPPLVGTLIPTALRILWLAEL
jgi:hypothetical protein